MTALIVPLLVILVMLWTFLHVVLSYFDSLPLIYIGLFPLRVVFHRIALSKRSLQAFQQALFDYIPLQWTAIEMVSLGITWVGNLLLFFDDFYSTTLTLGFRVHSPQT